MKRSRWFIAIGIFLALIVVVVYASQAVRQSTSSVPIDYYAAAAPTAAPQVAAQGGYAARDESADGLLDQQKSQQEPQPADPGAKRIVLKDAALVIVVDDVDAKMQAITDLSDSFGGWIVSANTTHANVNGKNQVQSATITIRIPADRLDEALAQIKTGVGTVQSENVSGQDVTQDYVDLASQLTNLQAAEKQLQEIMSRTTKIQDVLDVYNQLVSVREQIETIQGRIRYYDESSSFASVQVTVLPTPIVQPVEISGWRPLETARNAFQALINVLQGAADVVITVAIIGLPLLIVIGLPLWVIWRRRRATRRTVTAAT